MKAIIDASELQSAETMSGFMAQSGESDSMNDAKRKERRQKVRVLHVGKFYPPHMGGIETHLQTLCNELRKSVEVRVAVASDDRSAIEENVAGVPVHRTPTWLTLASTPLCPGLVSELRKYRGEILHLHLPNPMAVMAYLVSGYPGPVVVTYHSDMVRQKILGKMFEPFLDRALRRSAAVIATSPNYLQSSAVLARHRDRCHVIPLGIEVESFQRPDSQAVSHLRQKYGDRLIVSVGRLVYYKGFEYLIRAMQTIDASLLIIGEGPLNGKLIALARELGVADRVHLLGRVEHDLLVACYHAASVFALASIARSEAFGITQIEAMAAGLPVVNTSLDSGVPFVSVHEQTGLTVPPEDPDALAGAINRLLADEPLRQSLGQAARLRAQQEFSTETMTARTVRLYQDVMKRSEDRTLTSI